MFAPCEDAGWRELSPGLREQGLIKLIGMTTKLMNLRTPTLNVIRQPALALLCPLRRGAKVRMHPLPHACAWSVESLARGRKITTQVLHIHGGGMVSGDWAGFRGFCSQLSHELGGATVWCVNYRLVPEWTLRDAVDDVLDCLRLMHTQSPTLPIVCTADSGGAVPLILALQRALETPVSGCVLLSPMVDLNCNICTDAALDPFLSRSVLELCCRLCREHMGEGMGNPIDQELSNYPPMLILVAENELLTNDALKFADKAVRDGVRVRLHQQRNAFHAWPLMAGFGIAECDEGLRFIAQFIEAGTLP